MNKIVINEQLGYLIKEQMIMTPSRVHYFNPSLISPQSDSHRNPTCFSQRSKPDFFNQKYKQQQELRKATFLSIQKFLANKKRQKEQQQEFK